MMATTPQQNHQNHLHNHQNHHHMLQTSSCNEQQTLKYTNSKQPYNTISRDTPGKHHILSQQQQHKLENPSCVNNRSNTYFPMQCYTHSGMSSPHTTQHHQQQQQQNQQINYHGVVVGGGGGGVGVPLQSHLPNNTTASAERNDYRVQFQHHHQQQHQTATVHGKCELLIIILLKPIL